MKALVRAGGVIVLAAAMFPIMAQWPNYPTPNVPRLPDGEPNMDAPAPRTADGKPDLSGLWSFRGGGGGRGQRGQGGRGGRGGGDAPAAAPAPPPPPPAGLPPSPAPSASFFDILPQSAAPYTEWAAALRKQRMDDNMKDNPDAHCLPLGLTQLHMHPQPRKIVQLPNLIVILYEAQGGVRQIFMDGRPLPNNDPQPWWYGYSVGRWEGDTLVVETTGFRDDVWLDVNGSPLTTTGKMTERMRRLNYGTLETEITIEDPKSYTKPFTVKVNHRLMLDTDLIEFICNENEKSSQHFDP